MVLKVLEKRQSDAPMAFEARTVYLQAPQKEVKEKVIMFFWDMTPNPWVMGSRIFEAKLCFHIQG